MNLRRIGALEPLEYDHLDADDGNGCIAKPLQPRFVIGPPSRGSGIGGNERFVSTGIEPPCSRILHDRAFAGLLPLPPEPCGRTPSGIPPRSAWALSLLHPIVRNPVEYGAKPGQSITNGDGDDHGVCAAAAIDSRYSAAGRFTANIEAVETDERTVGPLDARPGVQSAEGAASGRRIRVEEGIEQEQRSAAVVPLRRLWYTPARR